MNSEQGLKGFITFLMISGIVGLSMLGIKYIPEILNLNSIATKSSLPPFNIQVKNIKSDSATISWQTDEDIVGILIYDLNNNDECFNTGNSSDCLGFLTEDVATKTHSITIKNLNPNTTYFYKIKLENNIYPQDQSISFSTATTQVINSSQNEISTQQNQPQNSLPLNTQPLVEDFEGFTNSSSPQNEDFEGFTNPQEKSKQVLGAQTSLYNNNLLHEFKNAILYQNIRYDFNSDGIVDVQDYPLFVNFIQNPNGD